MSFLDCTELLPGVVAWSLSATISLDKGGGTAVGNSLYILDTTAPFDCADGAQTTGPLTMTPLGLGHDEDGDGCRDWSELGTDETEGGLRDPFNPYDFYDVNGDGVIDLLFDVLGVIDHWAPTGAPPYDVNFDRGPISGPNDWNMTAPDGVIDLLNDILGVINQWNHNCN